ncbi:phosphatidylinositol N-acetylglucosaminyltransferase [Entamoeba marina]
MEPLPGCYRICLASDYFFPNMGGVEFHQYQIAHFFVRHGHKVVILTHSYGNRTGVRVLKNGIKIYYLPTIDVFNQCSFPTIIGSHPQTRDILIREQIDIVHSHQSFSTISLETIVAAQALGIRIYLTEHSLFSMKGLGSIVVNFLAQTTLANADGCVAVSHCTKENMCIRAKLNPSKIYVIPNALEPAKFQPDSSKKDPNCINIVILSRLVYRKGIDLVVGIIPIICKKYSNVNFIVGGDGPMMLNIEEMREKHQLQNRVKLLGAIQHCETRDVLVLGDIFLNCSLTEAFCIAIIEALSCGLHVVSTHVGGVPEVLPNSMIRYAIPTINDLCEKLEDVIPIAKEEKAEIFHENVKKFYSWERVATRTEEVYKQTFSKPQEHFLKNFDYIRYEGRWSWYFCFLLMWVSMTISQILKIIRPAHTIELAHEIPRTHYKNGLICPIGESTIYKTQNE